MKLINKIFLSIGLVAGSAAFVSCDLTTETQSSFDESVVFSNYTLAEFNVFGIYNALGEQNSLRGRYQPYYGLNSDIELFNDTSKDDDKSKIVRYKMTADNSELANANNPYKSLVGGIEKANLCIKGIRQYGNVENDEKMAELLGEALCARALIYTELLKAYGEVPARFEPVTPETIYLNKTEKDVIFKQLLADLEESFKYLKWPLKSANTSATDRPSLAFAKGLYARLALMASGYSLRPDAGAVGTGTPGTVRLTTDKALTKETLYPKALAALKDVINHAGLSLYADYEQLWRDVNGMNLAAGKEIIYSIPFSDGRGRWNYSFAIRTEGNPFDWNANQTSNRGGNAGPIPTMYWRYGEGDTRRDLSCVNFKWVPGANAMEAELAGPLEWYFGKFRFEWQTKSGYLGGDDDGVKPVYMRYSDILLMAAEIANDPACGERDEDFAKDRLLEVRSRAYKGNEASAQAYVNGLSGQDAIFNAIVDERALEFVGEMLRKNDLIRWNLLKKKMDESKAELQAFIDKFGTPSAPEPSGNSFGPAVWYKVKADRTLEVYGFDSVSSVDAAPAGDGWICHMDSSGKPTDYFKFIEEEKDKDKQPTGNLIYKEKAVQVVERIYDVDPDTKQWWPIPSPAIIDGQGYLVNDYGY